MTFSLRKFLSGKNDKELAYIHNDSQYSPWKAEREFKKFGCTSPELAKEACICREVETVTAAIIRGRIEDGSENSHLHLRATEVKVSSKRMDRMFGESLRERRRV